MRIAYFVSSYPSVPTFILNEMVEVQSAGHEIVIVPLKSSRPSAACQNVHDRVRPANVFHVSLINLKITWLALCMLMSHPLRVLHTLVGLHWAAGLNPYAHASLIAIVPKALAAGWFLGQAGVNHLHAHFATHATTCASIAGKVSGLPFSFTAHAYDIYCHSLKLRNETLSWKIRQAEHVFTVSQFGKKFLRQQFPELDHSHIHTAHVGIPISFFPEELPLPLEDKIHLLCVARFCHKKGIDTLVDACAFLRKMQIPFLLKIYGDGPLRKTLASQIKLCGLTHHIVLGGALSSEQIAKEMKSCHVFVMPCRQDEDGDMDGIPTVFMEAMASGRPVISSGISGIPELVRQGETGLLVPPDDPSSLADAITRLARDETLRTRLGRQARMLVERQHNQKKCAERILHFLGKGSLFTSPVMANDAKKNCVNEREVSTKI